MSNDPFDTPSSGDRIQDLEENLLLITPTEYLTEISTSYGDKDAVDADVVDLTNGVEYSSMRIFPGGLIGTLKRAAKFNGEHPGGDPRTGRPKMVLGRLSQGEAKKGQSPPWVLLPPSDGDKNVARDYLAKRPVDDPFDV